VKEQSHKDEMSAALRGDFARLRGRGVAATLAPRVPEAPQPAAAEPDETAETAEPDETAETAETEAPAAAEKAEHPVAEPGFFARMLGR
jgi:hypothetical protein